MSSPSLHSGGRMLRAGSVVRAWGETHTVVVFGSVPVLRSERGEIGSVTLTELLDAPDFEILGQEAANEPATSTLLESLTKHERKNLQKRVEHINEVLTGYRSGDPDRA